MFENGLHNRVDIYFLNRNMSSRTRKGGIRLSDTPDMEDVPCRIIKDKKALFEGNVKLLAGYTLKDRESGAVYKVVKGTKIYGMTKVHHSSYEIVVKAESELWTT